MFWQQKSGLQKQEKGQSLVEIALVLPLLLFLILATVDVGLGFRTYMVLTNGTREAVRWITVAPTDPAGAIQRAEIEAGRIGLEPGVLGAGGIVIALTPPQNGSNYLAGEQVTATIDHEYELMFGLFTEIPNLNIRAQSTMVVLYDE